MCIHMIDSTDVLFIFMRKRRIYCVGNIRDAPRRRKNKK